MRYTVPEAVREVLIRRERVRRKRERRRWGFFSIGVCAVLLFVTIRFAATPLAPPDASDASVMGSFLLPAESGGIAAAIVLGVLLAALLILFCIRKKRGMPPEEPKQPQNDDKDGGNDHE